MSGLSMIPVASNSTIEERRRLQQEAVDETRAAPVLQGLAAHTHKRWRLMRDHRREELEPRMKACIRARNMQYEPQKLSQIREQGGSEIFMGVVSTKCRTATAWLRETLMGTGDDKPWSISATPIPEPPEEVINDLQNIMAQNLQMYYAEGNAPLDTMELESLADQMKQTALRDMKHKAEQRVSRMERKMEDQMVEGGFSRAMHEFTDDIATFPFAVLKGPVTRRRKKLAYAPGGNIQTQTKLVDEWERVDPFKFYWAPWADDIHEAPCAELHHLTRQDVEAMIGVEGYNEALVRQVLLDFDMIGLDWLEQDDSEVDEINGTDLDDATSEMVTAVQLWDRVPGSMLIEWGVDEDEIEEPEMSYDCEVWLIGQHVVKAVLNYDELSRRPYYVTSFEKVPGRIDGNGVADLCMDAQNMCNAAARALANNMGISSGPQVGVNISRLPHGEDVTQMYPWKIWQFKNSDYNDNSQPMQFFQPNSNAQELMAVFDRFLSIADEVSGIPRYMTGQHVPGASRTSSGLSMLISNAGKSIKQVIGNVDNDVIKPMLERLYHRNLKYSDDPDLIGDISIVPMGAMSLVVKEAEAVRKTDFLRMLLQSPDAMGIVGRPGVAELLRDLAGNLNSNVDRIVPSREDIVRQDEAAARQQAMMAEMQQAMMAEQGGQLLQEDGTPMGGRQDNHMSPRPNGV